MSTDADILIVGGGLIGSTLALACAQSGFQVTLVDALPKSAQTKTDFDGRSYAMALATTRALGALGLWDGLKPTASPINEIKVSDGRPGEVPSPFFMHFDHADLGPDPMGYMIEDRFARAVLAKSLSANSNLTHLTGETVTDQTITGTGAGVTLASGKTLKGRVIIGCDGRQTGVGTRAGIKRVGWQYGQTSLVCAIQHEMPHHGIAHQLFLPAGPLALLPLSGNRMGMVWTEETNAARRIQAMDDAGYLDVLRPRFGTFLGDIALAGTRFSYPLDLTLAQSFVAPRVALVGDAAHGIHPIAGQGLNAGMKDVAALAEVFVDARSRGEDIGSAAVLQRYQQWRRFDATTLAVATDSFNRLFSNDNGFLRSVRDLGMGAVNALPGLRSRFMKEAAGLSGELPRLLQGKQLT